MMDRDQDIVITQYLQSLGIKEMEFFEEMYDHIATSYQNRSDLEQSLSDHIDLVVEPSFGGRFGIRKLKWTQHLTMHKPIWKKAFNYFLAFFYKWPYVLFTLGISSMLAVYFYQFNRDSLIYEAIQAPFIIPLLIMAVGSQLFGRECRRQGKAYTRTHQNNVIASVLIYGTALLYSIEKVTSVMLGYSSTLKMPADYPALWIVFGSLHIILAIICLKLYKEDYQTKLEFAS